MTSKLFRSRSSRAVDDSKKDLVDAAPRRIGWPLVCAVLLAGLSAGIAAGRVHRCASDGRHGQTKGDWEYHLPQPPEGASPEYRERLEKTGAQVAKLMACCPEDPGAVAALALLHYLSHDPEGESQCWEHCLELEPTNALAYARLVALAQQDARHDRVVELMHRSLAIDPANAEHQRNLGSALFQLHRYGEARDVLERQLRGSPGTVDTYLVLGRVYERLQELERARQCLETAVALDPQRSDALYTLATVSAKLGEEDKAAAYRAEFDEIKRQQLAAESKSGVRHRMQDPVFLPERVAEILRFAGQASRRHGNAALAEECLRQAVDEHPGEIESRQILAAIYESTERPDDALRYIRELKELEPGNLEHVQNEAVLCVRLKRFAEAERAFEELCRLAPQRGAGYAGLAELYLRSGKKLDEARSLANKAVELEPTGWSCALAATLAERDGDVATARKALERAMALEPQNALYRQMYAALEEQE